MFIEKKSLKLYPNRSQIDQFGIRIWILKCTVENTNPRLKIICNGYATFSSQYFIETLSDPPMNALMICPHLSVLILLTQ